MTGLEDMMEEPRTLPGGGVLGPSTYHHQQEGLGEGKGSEPADEHAQP